MWKLASSLLPLVFLFAACEPAKVGRLMEPGPNAVEVLIESEPVGAAVVVDGTPVGPAPQTVKLNPGPHSIKGTKSGYFAADQRLTISSSDKTQRVKLTLIASH